jgi:hypothetical protein
MKKLNLILVFWLIGAFASVAQNAFKRDLPSVDFAPKGQWIAGAGVSYSQMNLDNYQFLIAEDLKGDVYQFKVSPTLMYAFNDNMAVGGKFGYSRSRTSLDDARIMIDSETDYSAGDMYLISQDYSAMGVYRYYMSIGRSTRFGMFGEAQLDLGFGQSKMREGTGKDVTGSFYDTFSCNIGLAPGLVMFLNNYSAIEVNVGVLGFGYSHTKQTTNQVYEASYSSKSANLKLDILSISFGVLFYL